MIIKGLVYAGPFFAIIISPRRRLTWILQIWILTEKIVQDFQR